MNQPALVLASGSPRRKALLAGMGLRFTVRTADVDETPFLDEDPAALVGRLSRAKARAVAATYSSQPALVLGADTIVVHAGRILGKPQDDAEAASMLRQLRDATHHVLTGVAVVNAATGSEDGFVERTEVFVRPFDEDELARYVASGDPLDKAGAYAIQHPEFHPVANLRGSESNVIGLPIGRTRALLARWGVEPAP